jgi:hypothetical protein
MEIPKPVAWAIVIVLALLLFGVSWYFAGGSRKASGTVAKDAYPEVKGEMRLPDSELQQGPPPLPGVGGR